MSGDGTTDDLSQSLPGDLPGDAAAQAVPAFDVPEPESVDVPDAESAVNDFEVPPPPAFAEPAVDAAPAATSRDAGNWSPESTWSAERTWTLDSQRQDPAGGEAPTAAEPAPPTRRRRQVPTIDPASSPGVSRTERPVIVEEPTGAYRAWTIGIYGFLTVLFVGAVGFMFFLGSQM